MPHIKPRTAVRTVKVLLHWSDCLRIHHNHPGLTRFHSPRKCVPEFRHRAHTLRAEYESTGHRHEIRALEIDTNRLSLVMRILDVPQHAVSGVVEQNCDDRRV